MSRCSVADKKLIKYANHYFDEQNNIKHKDCTGYVDVCVHAVNDLFGHRKLAPCKTNTEAS